MSSQVASAIPSLSVVIPAYNAEAVLAATVSHAGRWLEQAGVRHEVIVVDDGSTDQTAEIARGMEPPVRLIRCSPNRGKGSAVRTGMLAATPGEGGYVLFMDADNSTPIEHLERFAPLLETGAEGAGAEVVIASRRLANSRIVRPQHRLRQALGRTFPYLVRLIALPRISDTQCGFKLFSARAAREIFSRLRTERFAFDVEALLLARRLGYRIAEVPVDWDNPTESTVRIHRDTVRMMWDLMKMSARLRRPGRPPARKENPGLPRGSPGK